MTIKSKINEIKSNVKNAFDKKKSDMGSDSNYSVPSSSNTSSTTGGRAGERRSEVTGNKSPGEKAS